MVVRVDIRHLQERVLRAPRLRPPAPPYPARFIPPNDILTLCRLGNSRENRTAELAVAHVFIEHCGRRMDPAAFSAATQGHHIDARFAEIDIRCPPRGFLVEHADHSSPPPPVNKRFAGRGQLSWEPRCDGCSCFIAKKAPDLIVGAEVLEVHLGGFRYIVRLDSGEKAIAFRGRGIKGRVFSVDDQVKVNVQSYDSTRGAIIGSASRGEDQG